MSGSALVVGGGLAGLTAAFRLQCAGLRVTLIDARAGLDDGAGEDLALAPLDAALPASAPALHGLACELGMAKQLRRAALARVELHPLADGMRALDSARHVTGASGPLAWLRLNRLRRLMRWYGPWLEPDAPERGERLDDRSVAAWCRLYLGESAARGFGWLLAAHYGIDAAQASRLLGLLLLDPLGAPRIAQPFGVHELRRALAARLAHVRLGERALRVAPEARVWLESGEELAADVAVLALPAAEIRTVCDALTPAERISLDRMGTSPRLQLAVRVRGVAARPSPVSWIDSPALAGVVDCAALGGETQAEERTLVFLAQPRFAEASLECSDAELAEELLSAAEPHLPGLGAACLARRVWRLTVPRFDVGHYRAVTRLRAEAPRVQGRAWVQGGDDLVAPHAEGAVVAGTRAAEEALLKLRAPRP